LWLRRRRLGRAIHDLCDDHLAGRLAEVRRHGIDDNLRAAGLLALRRARGVAPGADLRLIALLRRLAEQQFLEPVPKGHRRQSGGLKIGGVRLQATDFTPRTKVVHQGQHVNCAAESLACLGQQHK
jgi:hypothetical protein